MSSPRHCCPVCEARSGSERVFSHGAAPATQNTLYRRRADAVDCPRAPLAFERCDACGLVWNAAFQPGSVAYAPGYHVDQGVSAAFREHLDAVVDRVVDRAGPSQALIEVGCGTGRFLALGAARGAGRWTDVRGFDPAWSGGHAEAFTVERARFDESVARRLPPARRVVVARHLIEHEPRPVALLRAMATAAGAEGRVWIETPNVEFTLRRGLAHDFCHEHCTLFGLASIRTAYQRAGLSCEIELVRGGEYLLAVGQMTAARPAPDAVPSRVDVAAVAAFVPRWRAKLEVLRTRGGIAVWGAAGKGGMFAHLVDPDCTRLRCLIDLDDRKSGTFVPGTGHPVHGPAALTDLSIATVLVANRHYLAEVRELCDRVAPEVQVTALDSRPLPTEAAA